MGASATARYSVSGEHQKARYRVLVLGLLALLGPPAFGLRLGVFSVLYSLALVCYALWALRLSVVFHDDNMLGYLLCLFDCILSAPLLIWGPTRWLAVPVLLLLAAGTFVSALIRHGQPWVRVRHLQSIKVEHPGGFSTVLEEEVAKRGRVAVARSRVLGLVVLRIERYDQMVSYYGPAAAEAAVLSLARRALRVLSRHRSHDYGEVLRLRSEEAQLTFLSEALDPLEVAELAADVSRTANGGLVHGRRVHASVGYAVFPRDGATGAELMEAARLSTFAARPLRRAAAQPAAARTRVATG